MGANPLHDPTLAEKARQALEAEGVDTGAIKSNDAEDKKSAFQAKLLIDFVAAKPRLSDVLTDCKQMLGHMPTMGLDEAMQKAEEENIKKIISDLVKEVGLVHRDTKLDDNYNVVKANNYRAVNRILRCLKQNETVEQVLQCVYTHVYALLAAQAEEPAPQPNDNEDRFGSTEAFLSWLASEFAQKTEVVEVDGSKVIVPAAETVTLKQSAKTDTWCLYYNSICGAEENPHRGSEGDRYQARFAQVVVDQQKAAAADRKDLVAIAELIRESVPRHDDKTPKLSYQLMTGDSARELKAELAVLVGLKPDNRLLDWLLRELITGASPARIIELKAEKDREFEAARGQRQSKATPVASSLLRRRPEKGIADTESQAKPAISSQKARNLQSIRAYINAQVDGLSPEEARAKRDEILANAKAFLESQGLLK